MAWLMASVWIVPVYHPRGMRPQVEVRPPWHDALHLTSDWEEFVSYGERAACEILIVPWIAEWELWSDFVRRQRVAQVIPRIMVTTPDPENLRRTCSVVLHDFVWLGPTPGVELTDSITRAATTGHLFRCSSLLATAAGLHKDVRDALVKACHARPAVRKVNQLADLARCDRRTLWARWTDFVGPAPAPRPKELVDRIVLLRVITRRHLGERWSRIRRDLGVNAAIAADRVKARLGKELGEVTMKDARDIVRWLEGLLAGRPLGTETSEEQTAG